ncbi:hypothetical protein ABFX02_05G066300 [Erythranthe guttata]
MANSNVILSILIFSCFALYTPATCSKSKQTDLLSLLALKEAIVVDPNGALNSWNRTTNDYCRWNGIVCSRMHPDRVVAINLDSLGLVGSLSPHIGNLSFLRQINFQNNSLHGQIPQEIGLLSRIQIADLNNNSFSGPIPRNLSNCKNLLSINLIDNNLSGTIPPELASMHNLQTLGLGKNAFSGPIPKFLGNLSSLSALGLMSCGLLGEIPESLAQLRSLAYLYLGGNSLTGSIPTSLLNITDLLVLDLSSNRLQGTIPSTLGLTLPNLKVLYLNTNQFTGPVPVSLSNATSLEEIMFLENNFTGPMPRGVEKLTRLVRFGFGSNPIKDDISFITSLTNCTNLELLEVGQNFLSGSLPESITNLSTNLRSFIVFQTQVHGTIPSGIGNLVSLNRFSLGQNNLDGPIPLGIGKLTNLRQLYLRENGFRDEIPFSFGNLSLLNALSLSENNLSGSIPKSFGNCTKLLQLDLSRNNLNGHIPGELMNLSSISIFLDLSNNAFTGSIPVEVGSLSNLANLFLSNNKLSGLIPNSLRTCISLERLDMQGNSFEGQIPEGLSSLTGLIYLDLSRNNLSGSIPSFLGDLRLERLNLSFNSLEGNVPTTGVFKNMTAFSLQGNAKLCGGILELDLAHCTSSSSKKNFSTLLKIVIPVAGFVAILCGLVVFLYKKRRTPNASVSSLPSLTGTPFLRLSYSDLLKATGGFVATSLVGFGRFGYVYKGILDDGVTVVAVKVLNLVVKGASKSFLAECNSLRGVRHRNLVKILSVCESIDFQGNDFKALVYEFKENGNLDKWLYYNTEQEEESHEQLRNLDLIERLNIAIDVAQAIEYLHCGTDSQHSFGPTYMMACVGDFGLSKIISSIIENDSSTIGVKGTVGYVPPEYGMCNSVSTNGDVYSYGILVLEMFTNRRPTDDSFMNHVNLHNFVRAALPDRVMEIVDPLIRIGPHQNKSKFEDCVCSILRIGLSCSKEMPRERKSMPDVVNELLKIQKEFAT